MNLHNLFQPNLDPPGAGDSGNQKLLPLFEDIFEDFFVLLFKGRIIIDLSVHQFLGNTYVVRFFYPQGGNSLLKLTLVQIYFYSFLLT